MERLEGLDLREAGQGAQDAGGAGQEERHRAVAGQGVPGCLALREVRGVRVGACRFCNVGSRPAEAGEARILAPVQAGTDLEYDRPGLRPDQLAVARSDVDLQGVEAGAGLLEQSILERAATRQQLHSFVAQGRLTR